MANTIIQLKKSLTPGSVPSSLEYGEIAINAADGILYYKDPSDTIQQITSSATSNAFSTINVGSTLLVATAPNDILSISGNNGIFITGSFVNDSIEIDVNSADTTQKGVVQLYDGVDFTSTSLAATANAVFTAYNLASLAYNSTPSITTQNLKTQEFTATANQSSFIVTGGYTPEYISVHLNGVLLDTTDYQATNGTEIVLNTPAIINDTISISKWYFDNSLYLSAIQKVEEFTASANQILFTTSEHYTENYIKVYRNGILLESSDYLAPGGVNVTINYPIPENDIISLEYWGASTIDATPVYIIANNASNVANNASNVANGIATTASIALETANSKLDLLSFGDITSNSVSTLTNSSNQVLDIFSTTEFRSAKYQVQVTSGTDYQISEISLIHNDTNSFITEYGLIYTNSVLMTYDTDIISNNARLLMSPVNNVNTIKIIKTSVSV